MQDVREREGLPLLLLDRGRTIAIVARHVEGRGIRYMTLRDGEWTLLPPWRGPHPFGTSRLFRFRRWLWFRWPPIDAEAWRWLLPDASTGP